ncbi:MAG: site-specific DNA-methyltransferase [Elusimicrobiota bacterium]|jgi:modification methylase|nr:site-specific DNA-methyltransferase [Elusimicrobiota bacterium]
MKIIKGDTLEQLQKLPSNFVDMGVTSPPYNKQENKKGWLVANVKYDTACDKKDEAVYQAEQIKVLNELFRVIKPGGSFFYNHKVRWEKGIMLHPFSWIEKTNWNLRQEIIWDRTIAANIRGWRFWQVEERIYWLHKPKNNKDLIGKEIASKHALLTSIWRMRPEQSKRHPAAFPIELPIRCIYSIMDDKKGIVIDPYCGSGTTLVGAKLLGHDYIGIDISDKYVKETIERLNKSESERPKMQKEIDLHIVNETFEQRKNRGVYSKKQDKYSQFLEGFQLTDI